jgi:Tfp pilus assembly protein PilV
MAKDLPGSKSTAGVTLVEVVIAATILMITVVGISRFFTSVLREIDANRERLVMGAVALSRLEEWRSHPYKDLVPNMSFNYITRTVDRTNDQIVFSTHTLTVTTVSKVNLTIAAKTTATGYTYAFALPSGMNMTGGEDAGNQVWYDGPNGNPGNHTPGLIHLAIGCPPGVSGILTIVVLDYNNKQREEKLLVNGIVMKKYPAGSFGTAVSLANRTIQYTLTQSDTLSGVVNIDIQQTSDTNAPTFGGVNPNCVISSVKFDILEGFTEHEAFDPYIISSQIIPTYDIPNLVPGWQIMVTVSKEGSRSIFLATTIAQ